MIEQLIIEKKWSNYIEHVKAMGKPLCKALAPEPVLPQLFWEPA